MRIDAEAVNTEATEAYTATVTACATSHGHPFEPVATAHKKRRSLLSVQVVSYGEKFLHCARKTLYSVFPKISSRACNRAGQIKCLVIISRLGFNLALLMSDAMLSEMLPLEYKTFRDKSKIK